MMTLTFGGASKTFRPIRFLMNFSVFLRSSIQIEKCKSEKIFQRKVAKKQRRQSLAILFKNKLFPFSSFAPLQLCVFALKTVFYREPRMGSHLAYFSPRRNL